MTSTIFAVPALAEPLLPRTATRLHEKQPLRIVAFGDSISEVGRSPRWHGGASAPENNWARVLGVSLGAAYPASRIEVINAGIGGQNSYEGLGRIDVLEAMQPDLVLVAFGANDCAHHFLEPAATKLALTILARDIKQRYRADVMLLSTGGDNPREPFFQHLNETLAATREAAREAGVPYVDIRTPILAATENGVRWSDYHLASGNCHPNDAGHQIWARAVHAAITNALKP